MANKNGIYQLLKIIAVALAIAGGAGALMSTYIVGPVKDTAVEAKGMAKDNEGAIGENEKSIAVLEVVVDNTDKNVERLLGLFEVPTVKEVPSGELTIDPPPEQ